MIRTWRWLPSRSQHLATAKKALSPWTVMRAAYDRSYTADPVG